MTAPLNRDGKEANKIIAESAEMSKTMALMIYGFGRTMTILTFKPKQAAAHCIQAAKELETMTTQMHALAERIMDWDMNKIVVPGKTLVGTDLKPLDS
jgi:hypothetical protein